MRRRGTSRSGTGAEGTQWEILAQGISQLGPTDRQHPTRRAEAGDRRRHRLPALIDPLAHAATSMRGTSIRCLRGNKISRIVPECLPRRADALIHVSLYPPSFILSRYPICGGRNPDPFAVENRQHQHGGLDKIRNLLKTGHAATGYDTICEKPTTP